MSEEKDIVDKAVVDKAIVEKPLGELTLSELLRGTDRLFAKPDALQTSVLNQDVNSLRAEVRDINEKMDKILNAYAETDAKLIKLRDWCVDKLSKKNITPSTTGSTDSQ